MGSYVFQMNRITVEAIYQVEKYPHDECEYTKRINTAGHRVL